jgi:hypothetical protein
MSSNDQNQAQRQNEVANAGDKKAAKPKKKFQAINVSFQVWVEVQKHLSTLAERAGRPVSIVEWADKTLLEAIRREREQ